MKIDGIHSRWGRLAAATGALTLGFAGLVGASTAATADIDYGNIDETEGTIIVHKHADQSGTSAVQNPDGTGVAIPADPIAGVQFTIYRITDIDLTGNSGGWDVVNGWETTAPTIDISGATPTVGGYGTGPGQVLSNTDSDGVATSGTLPVGAYVVVETNHPSIVTAPAAPFVVTIPTPHADGWVYDVNVYPKNAINPLIPTKSVSSPSALGLGATVDFPVTTPIRNLAGPTNFSHYWVQDVLDSRLTNVDISSVTIDGVAVDASLYTVVPASAVNGNLVSLTFNQAGLEFLKTQGDKSLVTTFTGTVGSVAGGAISNTAYFSADTVVELTPPASPSAPPTDPNEPNYPGEGNYPGIPTVAVETNWGDLWISKVDSSDDSTGLEGAQFEVYAVTNPYATDASGAGAPVGDAIEIGGLTEFSSNASGLVNIDGLFVSDTDTGNGATFRWYAIREVEAPTGYVLPDEAYTLVQVSVGTSTTADETIVNTQQSVPNLPLTGANGQLLMTIAGIALILVAGGGALAVRNRSKSAE